MPSEKGKYIRVSVDLTEKEFNRLQQTTERIGATKAGWIRKTIEEKIDQQEKTEDDQG